MTKIYNKPGIFKFFGAVLVQCCQNSKDFHFDHKYCIILGLLISFTDSPVEYVRESMLAPIASTSAMNPETLASGMSHEETGSSKQKGVATGNGHFIIKFHHIAESYLSVD